jgi:lysophospholipase
MSTFSQPVADALESEFRSPDGLRLYYQRWVRPDVEARRVVVLVHGFADHSGRYEWLVQDLTAHGAVVYAYDQRGNGNSEGKRGHVMDLADFERDLAKFYELAITNEPGLERVLLAHSTGAIWAVPFAIEHSDRVDRFILSAPALILAVKAPAWKTTLGKVLAGVAPTVTMSAGFHPALVSRDETVVEKNIKDPLVTQAITTRYYREVYLKGAPAALARIEELTMPLLVIQGSEDRLVSTQVAEEFRQRAKAPHEVVVYPGSRHETYNDLDRERVFADIERWLESSPV